MKCLVISSVTAVIAFSLGVVLSVPSLHAGYMFAGVNNAAMANDNSVANAQKPSINSVTIPIRHDERALLVNADVDRHHLATFILDTGATYTSISEEMAKALGYDLTQAQRVTITTANGQISIPKITLKEISLNGYRVQNVDATVISLPKGVPFSGLLGLNFIKRHRVTIDSDSRQLVLEPSRS